jgi:hypothetical protein
MDDSLTFPQEINLPKTTFFLHAIVRTFSNKSPPYSCPSSNQVPTLIHPTVQSLKYINKAAYMQRTLQIRHLFPALIKQQA